MPWSAHMLQDTRHIQRNPAACRQWLSSGARSGSWSSPRSESLARFPVPPEPESGVVPILCWFSSGCTISVPVVFWSRLFKGEFAQAQGLPMPLNSPTLIQLPTSGNGRSTPRAINCPAWHHAMPSWEWEWALQPCYDALALTVGGESEPGRAADIHHVSFLGHPHRLPSTNAVRRNPGVAVTT